MAKYKKPRFKFKRSDVARVEREVKGVIVTRRYALQIENEERPPSKSRGVSPSEVSEVMRIPKHIRSREDAKNGLRLNEIIKAAPWREEEKYE